MDIFSPSDMFETKKNTLSEVLFGSDPVMSYEERYNRGKILETQSKLRNLFK